MEEEITQLEGDQFNTLDFIIRTIAIVIMAAAVITTAIGVSIGNAMLHLIAAVILYYGFDYLLSVAGGIPTGPVAILSQRSSVRSSAPPFEADRLKEYARVGFALLIVAGIGVAFYLPCAWFLHDVSWAWTHDDDDNMGSQSIAIFMAVILTGCFVSRSLDTIKRRA